MNLSKKQEERLHEQIQDNYKKAFFDLLEQKIAENPPDYDWIVLLYKEIRYKLTFFFKKR